MTTKPEILTDEKIDEIEKRANAATKGPWYNENTNPLNPNIWYVKSGSCATSVNSWGEICSLVPGTEEDAVFLASSRTDIPALIASHRLLQARVRELEAKQCQ